MIRRPRSLMPLLMVALITLIVTQNAALHRRRTALFPAPPTPEAEITQPLVNLVQVGLGGFRGLITDILWIRVSMLQEHGRYVELVQLADWITKLDPHAAEAWSYHAWNMAYNVSIMLRRPEDRMRWVRHGIALLRDNGLRYNPREARIYRELAWLYRHKIAGRDDAAHYYYKSALADDIAPHLLTNGRAPPVDSSKADRLLEQLGMHARIMHEIEATLGNLDWRLAESFAIYWAWLGIQIHDRREDLPLRRILYHALIAGVTSGRLDAYDYDRGIWATSPNPDLIPGAVSFLEETRTRYAGQGIDGPYVRFLGMAIHMTADDPDIAHVLYDRLAEFARVAGLTPPAYEAVASGDFSSPVFNIDGAGIAPPAATDSP